MIKTIAKFLLVLGVGAELGAVVDPMAAVWFWILTSLAYLFYFDPSLRDKKGRTPRYPFSS